MHFHRHRRLRNSASIRKMMEEYHLAPQHFIVPIFIVEGKNVSEEIPSMPGYYRYSIDKAVQEIQHYYKLGLQSVLLFTKIPDNLKDNTGKEALNKEGLMPRSIQAIKDAVPEICIMTDVALDPYSIYGHDGIVQDNSILNDETVRVLTEMACVHAAAGADFVAPSDMMDGRITAIRKGLDLEGYHDVSIMSYSAKYASSFYGPFRDALDSAPGFGDKKTYQMDFHNASEALSEIYSDIEEGADIIMIKPGMPYLDIVKMASLQIDTPIAVYQVSGEYAMLQSAIEKGWLSPDCIYESLISFRRAGAQLIATYFAPEIVKEL